MKIIHTSDWHLGQNFYRFDREEEHRYFFDQLSDALEREQPDALLVSGDVFHNSAPTIASQKLMVEGIMQLHDAAPYTTIIITAGNHDSGSRLDAQRELWRRLGIHVIGGCLRLQDGTFSPKQFVVELPGKGYILAAPYFHPSNYPMADVDIERNCRQRSFFEALLHSIEDKELPVVMMAHLAVVGCDTEGHEDEPIGGMMKENLSELGEGYDYLALGHIHKPQAVSSRAYYSGSPFPMTFSEDYVHSVNLVTIANHGDIPDVKHLTLKNKRNVRTVPPKGAPLAEALEAFKAIDAADDSYIRILIDQADVLAADAEDRALKIAADKACRFCELRRKPREYHHEGHDFYNIQEVDDFRIIDPMEIAKRSFMRKHNVDMNDTLVEMMKETINLINKELK